MVRKVSLLVGLLFLFSLAAGTRASAQDKVELYGGYSFFHLENSPGANNLNGFIFSGEYKFAPWVGAVGEVGGDYGGGSSLITYLVGPQVSFPARVSPFAHILIGGAHYGQTGFTDNSFATSLGFGIDAKIASAFKWRIIEGDYVTTHFGGVVQNNARISTGIVFRF
ncbi:MAG: hypothetical protein ABSC10_12305 [Candidatus Acidiferrales bacterium]|jgi:hypothetical protein